MQTKGDYNCKSIPDFYIADVGLSIEPTVLELKNGIAQIASY